MGTTYNVKVAVLASNLEGAPEFFWAAVSVTDNEWATGAHRDKAKKLAAEKGYVEPMLTFDLNDPAAHQLGKLTHYFLGSEEGRHILDRSE